jgi:hypothetical protein
MSKNAVKNAVAPHRSQRRMVTIAKEGKSVPVIVEEREKTTERPVRGSKLFQMNFMKNFGRAREGREDEWPEDTNQ